MSKQNGRLLGSLAVLLVFALLPAGYRTTPASAQSPNARVQPASDASPEQDTQARKVIEASVVNVNGMQFPDVTPPPNPSAKLAGASADSQGICTPGQTRSLNVASIDIESPKNSPKSKMYPSDGPIVLVYSSPAGWVISSYSRVQLSAISPYYASDSSQPANFNYLMSSEYQSVLEEMKNYVLKADVLDKYKADLNAKLEEMVKSYAKYSLSISTSHGAATHTARVSGAGLTNGRSTYHGYLYVNEICSPPELKDAMQLKAKLAAWVDQTTSKLPKGMGGRFDSRNPEASPRLNVERLKNVQVVPSKP